MTRREFFERASCAAAVLAAARPTAAATTALAATTAPAATMMFVSLNGAVARGVNGADKIRFAARLNYGGVDWDLGPAKADGADATRALFKDLKIVPAIVNLPMARPFPFGGEDAAFKEALKPLADDAAFVNAVGCTKMMLVLPASSQTPKAEMRKLAVDRLSAVAAVLDNANVRLGLEFLGPLYFRTGRAGGPAVEPFIWNRPEAVALAKDTGRNMGVVVDAWHWHHSSSTIGDILGAGAQRIVHVHISDAKAAPAEEVRDNQRLMPGEGIIDLVGFLQALDKAGYRDGVSPEPLGRIPEGMPAEEAAKLALDTTIAVMKRAGVR